MKVHPQIESNIETAANELFAFHRFSAGVKDLMEAHAETKGYSFEGSDGDNKLYKFISGFIGGHEHSHPLGEIVYKAVRFRNKGNREDLLKIAAWAFLVWKHTEE